MKLIKVEMKEEDNIREAYKKMVINEIDFTTFRSNALQGLTLDKKKSKKMSKDEIEKWIKDEYKRHYGK